MRFQHLLTMLSQPQLITAEAHASILQLLTARIENGPQREDGAGPCGEKVVRPSMVIENGIAFVPVPGVIGKGLTAMEKGSGAVDVSEIEKDLVFAVKTPEVRGIVMDVDSPGGMYQGTPELASFLAGIPKKTATFVDGTMASGALWLGTSVNSGVFATPTASIGSIGAYVAFPDVTERLKMMGIKMEMFSSGKYKGMGHPGVPLTGAQRDLIADRVMSINREFRSHVAAMRGDSVPAEAMQGQTFNGREAVDLGLIDGCCQSRAEFMANLPNIFQIDN